MGHRLCSRIIDYDKSGYQVESGKEGFAQLVIAGGNAPEVFDLVEEALDKVAMAVKVLVVMELFTPRADWRNYGLNSVIREAFADAIGIIAFIEYC